MPVFSVLDSFHPAAFEGFGENTDGLVFHPEGFSEGIQQIRQVMAVSGKRFPAKASIFRE